MKQQDDLALALDIVGAGRLIEQFVSGHTDVESFKHDAAALHATIYQLIVIGEATKRLSAKFRAEHATIAWSAIAGMRDKLTHGYRDVDIAIVWSTATKDVPVLVQYLAALLPPE